jgi:hypothetical protein
VPFSLPFGATAYAAEAKAPSTVVTLDHLILIFAPGATDVGYVWVVVTDTSPSAIPVLHDNVNVVVFVVVVATVLASAGEEYAARLAMTPANNVTDRTTRRIGPLLK